MSVHLIAQASSADLAANTSTSEKEAKLVDTIAQMLEQLGLENVDSEDLKKRLQKVDVGSGDVGEIVKATSGYMKEGLGMAAERVEELMEHGKVALGHVLPSLGIISPGASEANGDVTRVDGETGVDGVVKGKSKPVVIEDVKAFKASLPLMPGPRAAKDLSEFEELGPRL